MAIRTAIAILVASFLASLFIGLACEPKNISREPIVIIADELVCCPAGQPYTPPKDGYWLSKEALIRLLERLEDLQYQIDSMPKAELYHDGGPDSGDSTASMPADSIDSHIGFLSGVGE
mgnify:CR=1 FL=1